MIELHGAFVWDCDECGRENFCRAVEADLDEAVAKEIQDRQISAHFETVDATPGEGAMMESPYLVTRVLIGPPFVTCAHCGHTFEAQVLDDGDR